MKRVVINIRASKNISGLVKVSVTSSAGLMKFFLNVEPWPAPILHKDLWPTVGHLVHTIATRGGFNGN